MSCLWMCTLCCYTALSKMAQFGPACTGLEGWMAGIMADISVAAVTTHSYGLQPQRGRPCHIQDPVSCLLVMMLKASPSCIASDVLMHRSL